MKKFAKLFGIITVVTIIGLTMIGCGGGGTIIIENTENVLWSVAISRSSAVPPSEKTDIRPGERHVRSFSFDGTYYVFGFFVADGWRRRSVRLSSGETVIIIPDNFRD